MSYGAVIWWVRRDLRLADNPALRAAADSGRRVIPVFVLDMARPRAPGGAGLWWLDKSLHALGEALERAGSPLVLRKGATVEQLLDVARAAGASALHFGRMYEGEDAALEDEVVSAMAAAGVEAISHTGSLLTEPGEVKTGSGEAYKVYGPFWRALRAQIGPVKLTPAVRKLTAPAKRLASEPLAGWALHPTAPDWSVDFTGTPGEAGAHAALDAFVHDALARYQLERSQPAQAATGRLSPHLHWGELSSCQVWVAACNAAEARGHEAQREKFLSELAWRDFSHTVLASHPHLASRNYLGRLEGLRWREDEAGLPSLGARPHGLSDSRRRHARAVALRLDAQPRAHDHRQLPHQGSLDRLAARRAVVLGLPCGRRRGQQRHQLAVGGGHGAGRVTLLPRVHSGGPGREVRPGRRLRPQVVSPNSRTCPTNGCTARGTRPTRCSPKRA